MLVIPDFRYVVIGVIERRTIVEIVVAYIVHALIWLHNGVAFTSAMLFLPCLSVGQKLVKIHTEKLGSAFACASLADETCL